MALLFLDQGTDDPLTDGLVSWSIGGNGGGCHCATGRTEREREEEEEEEERGALRLLCTYLDIKAALG